MKKTLFLSLYLLCTTSLTALAQTSNTVPNVDNEHVVIDTTTSSNERCGIDGISCNDTALINYSKTEADFRKNVERTKRDHLYTQASTGNNLSATVRPAVENDIVVNSIKESAPDVEIDIALPLINDGNFSNTGTLDIETHVEEHLEPTKVINAGVTPLQNKSSNKATTVENNETIAAKNDETIAAKNDETLIVSDNEVGRADNIDIAKKTIIKTVTEEDGTMYEIVCQDEECTKVDKIKQILKDGDSEYEIICEENCEDIMIANADDDTITSEFTEESFDIADYIEAENDETDIEFYEVGSKETLVADASVKERKITDETILTWEAEEGDNLRELLTKWSAMSGWKLLWNTNRNYTLSAGVMFKGNFADVSSALIRAFARARPAPIATYYKGNRVIVVETMENENAY